MQNRIRKKTVLRWIEKQSKLLEPEEYMAFPKEFGVPPHLRFKRKKVEPYWYVVPTSYPVNHKRRIWGVYKQEGLEGVNAYFAKRGFSLNSLQPKKE